jgi:hypothetical protein
MGYRAYQEITRTITRGEGYDDLIMEGKYNATVVNRFCLCSAYEPTELSGPYDMLCKLVADAEICSDGDTFCIQKEDFEDLIKDMKKNFPDHDELEDTIKDIQEVLDREPYEDFCYFTAF